MIEEWRAIPGFEGTHEVSNFGRARSLDRTQSCKDRRGGRVIRKLRGKILSPRRSSTGHLSIQPRRGTAISIHIAILCAFVGPQPDGKEGCHNDGNPGNNRLENLRWDTRSENVKDAFRHGTRNSGNSNFARLTENDIPKIRELLKTLSIRQIAEQYEIDQSAIRNIKKGKAWWYA